MAEQPNLQDQQAARESLPMLTKAIAQRGAQGVHIQIQPTSHQATAVDLTIPAKALQLLAVILDSMAQGKTISLLASDSEMSTQQAAGLLQMSRPHLVKLLEEGLIPFRKVGSHRRLLLRDILSYEAQQKERRQDHLRFLAQQAQELNLGYE